MNSHSSPTSRRPRCAIYTRISLDRRGESLGVQRQEEACRALAEQLGYDVVMVAVENSVSAYSGAPRPEYQRMIAAIEHGDIDVVVVWNLDRLYRRMKDLEAYIVLVEATGVQTSTVMAGAFDLNTSIGRAMARTSIAFATLEVDQARDRVIAAKAQAAKAGKTSGGNRAYGWHQNGMDIIKSEAVIVREVVDRYIAGESWRSIALNLNDRAVPTAKGKKWAAINVRNVATLPRHYGIRTHNGAEYPAAWQPLLERSKWEELQLAIKRGQALNQRRSNTRAHLLKGFVYCGACGCRMNIVGSQQRDGGYKPSFTCRKKDHRGQVVGCGSVKRLKDPIEHLVIETIMYRLDTPALDDLLNSASSSTPEVADLLHQLETQQARLSEILDLYSTGELDHAEYKAAKATAQTRLKALQRDIDRKMHKATIGSIPVGQTVREAWEKADLMWRRQLVDTLIERIEVSPRPTGSKPVRYADWWFDPSLIRVLWKS